MLKLIKGYDRVSLSDYALEHIRKCALNNREEWILIVPEQFSFEAELRLCGVCGDAIARYAEVLSFSRLAERVAAEQGGVAGEYLDKGGQLLTMALAAEQVASRIKLYASVLRKPEFLADMVRTIDEFRSYCVLPADLFSASMRADGQFSQKLEELGLLYEAYLAVCANGKADPADKLNGLLDMLTECRWIKEKHFYIDGFSDFTGVELKVIELLAARSESVVISVPIGEKDSASARIANKTLDTLKTMVKGKMQSVSEENMHSVCLRSDAVLTLLQGMFSHGEFPEAEPSGDIRLVNCSSVTEECRSAAKAVGELLLGGCRCRDICVACADLAAYEVPIKNAFRNAGLPIYVAGERSLLSKPVVTAVLNSLFAASGPMEYEDVALYLKSGFASGTVEQWDRLDNYAYLWNIKGNGWLSAWRAHPAGFGEQIKTDDEEYLALLNHDRDVVMQPILKLRRGLLKAENTGEMVLALYAFLQDISLQQKLETRANAYLNEGKGQAAQELAQIYELLLQSMEQTWLTVGETVRSPEDFCRLFQTVLTQYQVATIPAGLDQIHISDVPDMRYAKTKHLIILGASDGKFPSYKTTEGLLTEEERRKLIAQGLTVAPGRADRLDQELSRICFAMMSATETVMITCSGEQPSWLFRRAASLYPGSVIAAEGEIVLNEWELAASCLRNDELMPRGIDGLEQVQEKLVSACQYGFEPLTQAAVQTLYGSQIALSPSKIDKYVACKFAYFVNYGLRAKPRKQAKLDQPAFGTFVHAVLERTVLRVNELGGFDDVTQEEILAIASEEIVRYADMYFPEQAKREEYLFNRSKKEIKEIVMDLWEELRRSKFRPVYCELKFTGGDELPAVEISGSRAMCRVVGMVDRVDSYRVGDTVYVRVVDYKTGSKDFDYTDILNGAGLQMLIYLFALRTFGKDLFGTDRVEPAGVLYLPARKSYPLTEAMPDDFAVQQKHRELRKRKGLIRCEEFLLAAMEENMEDPRFMPYKNGKMGITGDLADEHQMRLLEHHVARMVANVADGIYSGDIMPDPIIRGQHSSCKYCDYKTVCHKDMGTQKERVMAETSASKFWEILEQEEKHG